MPDRDYAAIGWAYARAVVANEIPACKYTRQACQRSLDDLARQNTEAFPYRWDAEAAALVCDFVEQLPHIKGRLARKKLILQPWQVWIFSQVMGWVHSSGERKGFRKYRHVHLEVPRSNGKSFMSAGAALYMLAADGEEGAEVYTAATTGDQAKIVFDVAHKMVKSSTTKPLMQMLGITETAHAILVEETNSKMNSLNSKDSSLDGLNIHHVCIDEIHAHRNRDLYDVLAGGAGKRDNSIVWTITTAGFDTSGIAYENRTLITKILEKTLVEEEWFGCIWTIDDEDDWTDPASWAKANPNWGVSVNVPYFQGQARQAMAMPAKQKTFLTKFLNVWVDSAAQFFDQKKVRKCLDTDLDIRDFEGQRCYIGLDLATKIDMTAKVLLFPKVIDDVRHWYAFYTFYLPEETLKQSDNASYDGWVREGWITPTDGNKLDFKLVKNDILTDMKRFNVIQLGFDTWQSDATIQDLQNEGVPAIEFRQNVSSMSGPFKEMDALIRAEEFHFNNPVMVWMCSNTVADTRYDHFKPEKERPENKIDGVDATVTALGIALVNEVTDTSSIYEREALFVI